MIVFVVYVSGVAFEHCECNAPIAAYAHCPRPFPLTFQSMKFQPGQIHIVKCFSSFKKCGYLPQPRYMLLVDAFSLTRFEQISEALMSEFSDHYIGAYPITLQVSIQQWAIFGDNPRITCRRQSL